MTIIRLERAKKVSGLYVIIDPEILDDKDPLLVTHQVLHGGVTAIQLRDKLSDQSFQVDMARKMLTFARSIMPFLLSMIRLISLQKPKLMVCT